MSHDTRVVRQRRNAKLIECNNLLKQGFTIEQIAEQWELTPKWVEVNYVRPINWFKEWSVWSDELGRLPAPLSSPQQLLDELDKGDKLTESIERRYGFIPPEQFVADLQILLDVIRKKLT